MVEEGGLRVGMIVSGRRIPIMDFSVSPSQPPPQAGIPVSARTPVQTIVVRGRVIQGPNRFLARMKSGHLGVFHRSSGSKSLPIDEEFRPAISELIREHTQIRPAIQAKAGEVFSKALDRTLRAELAKEK